MKWFELSYKNPFRPWGGTSIYAVQAEDEERTLKRWATWGGYLHIPSGAKVTKELNEAEVERYYQRIR